MKPDTELNPYASSEEQLDEKASQIVPQRLMRRISLGFAILFGLLLLLSLPVIAIMLFDIFSRQPIALERDDWVLAGIVLSLLYLAASHLILYTRKRSRFWAAIPSCWSGAALLLFIPALLEDLWFDSGDLLGGLVIIGVLLFLTLILGLIGFGLQTSTDARS